MASAPKTRGQSRPPAVVEASNPIASPPTEAGASGDGEKEQNTLMQLTERFRMLLQQTPDGLLDLNRAADELKVQKRRIYDITNVMEGIGLIEKKGKNHVLWRGANNASDEANDIARHVETLRARLVAMEEEEELLDSTLAALADELAGLLADPTYAQHAYLTQSDIRSLPIFARSTVIAVRAPDGTRMEVPDPIYAPEGGAPRYHVFFRAPGPMNFYLISKVADVKPVDNGQDNDQDDTDGAGAGQDGDGQDGMEGGQDGSAGASGAASSSHGHEGSSSAGLVDDVDMDGTGPNGGKGLGTRKSNRKRRLTDASDGASGRGRTSGEHEAGHLPGDDPDGAGAGLGSGTGLEDESLAGRPAARYMLGTTGIDTVESRLLQAQAQAQAQAQRLDLVGGPYDDHQHLSGGLYHSHGRGQDANGYDNGYGAESNGYGLAGSGHGGYGAGAGATAVDGYGPGKGYASAAARAVAGRQFGHGKTGSGLQSSIGDDLSGLVGSGSGLGAGSSMGLSSGAGAHMFGHGVRYSGMGVARSFGFDGSLPATSAGYPSSSRVDGDLDDPSSGAAGPGLSSGSSGGVGGSSVGGAGAGGGFSIADMVGDDGDGAAGGQG